MHQFLKFICFEVALYMFRTVFPSIIRGLRLYTGSECMLAHSQKNPFDKYLMLHVQS